MQDMEAAIVDGNGAEAGHIIVTTIGGKNGQPKQVRSKCYTFPTISTFERCLPFPSNSLLLEIPDDKLYGRAGCWAGVIWNSLPGEAFF